MCEVQAKSWKFGELYLGSQEIACWKSELSLHTIILSWQFYYIESELWHPKTRKNQKITWSPHILGEIKRICKQCVPCSPTFFAGDEATTYDTPSSLFFKLGNHLVCGSCAETQPSSSTHLQSTNMLSAVVSNLSAVLLPFYWERAQIQKVETLLSLIGTLLCCKTSLTSHENNFFT